MRRFILTAIVALVGICARGQQWNMTTYSENPEKDKFVFYQDLRSAQKFVLDSSTGDLWEFHEVVNEKKLIKVKYTGLNPEEADKKYNGRFRLSFWDRGIFYLFDTHNGMVWQGRVDKPELIKVDYQE